MAPETGKGDTSASAVIDIIDGLVKRLEKFETNFRKSPKLRLTQSHLKTRLNLVNELWIEYKNVYSETNRAGNFDDRELDAYSAGEEQFINLIADISELLEQGTPTTPIPTPQPQAIAKSEIKLPRISLPSFAGDYLVWTSFRDLYKTLVHDSKSISAVEKLHYLKSNLSGEAEHLLRNIETTDSNYEDAWQTLVKRYDNKRVIVYHHFKCLTSQPSLHTESSAAIKKLLDTTSETLRALKNIGLPTQHWDDWIVYMVIQKLDGESLKQWEMTNAPNGELPTWEKLQSFLHDRFRVLEVIAPTKPKPTVKRTPDSSSVPIRILHTTSSMSCVLCQKTHPLYSCFRFQKMNVDARRDFVRINQLCFNCLRSGHYNTECKSIKNCSRCNQRHHSLVHEITKTESNEDKQTVTVPQKSTEDTPFVNILSAHVAPTADTQVLLATALVKVQSAFGVQVTLRALLDQGSQATFITEEAASKLGLQRRLINIPIVGVGSVNTGKANHVVKLEIQSIVNPDFKLSTSALVLKTVTAQLPTKTVATSTWPHLSNLQLADPFYCKPGAVDLLIGADVFGDLLLDGIIKSQNGSPTAQNTTLGWILSGRTLQVVESLPAAIMNFHSCCDISNPLKSFWEIDELTTKVYSADELKCEELYSNTHRRSSEGNYVVNLPFIHSRPDETTFGQNVNLREEYCKFMKDYLDQRHMEIINDPFININRSFYMSHHAVFKQSSTSTKLRVVFDASRKSSNGISLNQTLMVGPTIQPDLISIIMNWRTYKIAFTADIKQMYRQIRVSDNDTDFQRIVWRSNPEDPIIDFRLNTVTYGTASAPYLAIRTLMQLASDEKEKFPLACRSVQHEMYVDDVMSGGDSIESAQQLQRELIKLLKSGGFELRKWSSNHPDVLRSIPIELHETKSPLDIHENGVVKTLGISWNPTTDELGYNISTSNDENITKRNILADISRLFDPLGWVSPCIIIAKTLLQRLWLAKVGWDDPVPEEIKQTWLSYRDDLPHISQIRIPRWLNSNLTQQDCELHGFSDASNAAYAAAIYSRTVCADGTVRIGLISAKTRVSPIKQVSLPRLELCGALLMARLFSKVTSVNAYQHCVMHGWTDSTIVLHWLKGHPNRWKPFIANRVTEILNINIAQWRHVSSEDNPADCASRGVSPSLLQNHPLWWTGPTWLALHSSQWPNKQQIVNQDIDLEERKLVNSTLVKNDSWDLVHKYSSISKLVRITAYLLRFRHNVSNLTNSNKKLGFLSIDELSKALVFWLKHEQQTYFQGEIKCCTSNVPIKGTLASLNPFLDDDGLLRVGGRLEHSYLPYSTKHPIIVPRNSPITIMIISQAHSNTLHGGITQTLGYTRRKYWIINGRNLVRQFIHKCLKCIRYSKNARSQLMGNLPSPRVTRSRPFQHSGVDYAGPILLRMSPGRGSKAYKGYICIFVCFCTKAVHLEIVSDLTTIAFIAAFKRFTSRRGKITDIYSDNGTTFVGAAAELKVNHLKAMRQLQFDIAENLANDGTRWHFIPPGSPHFGGLWEAGVKSIKFHLRRIIGDNKLTYEEMSTVLTQIEGALNSRPLCPIRNDPNDLTPGHFLIGDAINSIPEPSMLNLNENHCSRWQLTQRMYQHFWKRWSSDYLSRLQQRPKWMHKEPEIEVGDLVLLKDENFPPSK